MISIQGVPVKNGRYDVTKGNMDLQKVFDGYINAMYGPNPPPKDSAQYQELHQCFMASAQLTQQYIVDLAELEESIAETKLDNFVRHIECQIDRVREAVMQRAYKARMGRRS